MHTMDDARQSDNTALNGFTAEPLCSLIYKQLRGSQTKPALWHGMKTFKKKKEEEREACFILLRHEKGGGK